MLLVKRRCWDIKKIIFCSLAVSFAFFFTACGQEDQQNQQGQQAQQSQKTKGPITRTIPMQPDGPPVRGNLAPDFTLTDLEGRTWTLSELKGQVVFINFWATWCPPCISEMPSMQNLYDTLPKDQFKMLALLYNDEAGNAEKFAEKLDISLPILVDKGNRTGMRYGLTGVPETFILDKEGIIRETVKGPAEWDSAEVIHMLRGYIDQ